MRMPFWTKCRLWKPFWNRLRPTSRASLATEVGVHNAGIMFEEANADEAATPVPRSASVSGKKKKRAAPFRGGGYAA